MDEDQIRQGVEKILKTMLDLKDSFTGLYNRNAIPDWDSLKNIEIFLALESEFGVQFEPEQIAKLEGLGQITVAIVELGKGK